MNLPNKITLSRIILTFILMVFIFSKGVWFRYLAFFTFLIAAVTDMYDGAIAKKRNEVTDFGRFMDPIADKILVIAVFLAFVELKLVPAWMVLLILTRELVITGLRLLAAGKGREIPVTRGGKHKTISQMVAIFVILGFLALKETFQTYTTLWNVNLDRYFSYCVIVLMSVTVVLTLISGFAYLWRNKSLIFHAQVN